MVKDVRGPYAFGMRFAPHRRLINCLSGTRARLRLSFSEVVAVCAALTILGASIIAFGGVTEDVTQHNGLSSSDLLHLRWFTTHRSGTVVSAARLLSDVGNITVLGLVAVIAAVLLWRHGTRLVVAVAPGIALTIGGACAALAKAVIARGRPPAALHLVNEGDASFPSGHATDTTALYVTLALVVAIYILRRPLLRLASLAGSGLVAGAVGVSRLFLGVHWPTDVLAGWALGASVALAVTIAAGLAVRITPSGPPEPNRPILARVLNVMTRDRRTQPLQAA